MLSNKKAVSEIVSYVLLIVIAIGISVTAYSFLKLYVPKESPQCPADVSLIINGYSCSASPKQLVLNISNRGFWTVQAAQVRFGDQSQTVRDLITNKISPSAPDGLYLSGAEGLSPGNMSTKIYTRSLSNIVITPNMEVQVTPQVVVNDKIVLCEKAITVQSIACN